MHKKLLILISLFYINNLIGSDIEDKQDSKKRDIEILLRTEQKPTKTSALSKCGNCCKGLFNCCLLSCALIKLCLKLRKKK